MIKRDQECSFFNISARLFARDHPDLDVERVEKYVCGEMRQIRAYPAVFFDTLKQLITEHTSDQ